MSRKNTRHRHPLQQLPRFVRAAVYDRLTIRHYSFFKERPIWHGPIYKILANGSPSNLAQTLKRNHRYDNKPRTPFYKGLHRNRRKLKRFIERAKWAQEHPQNPVDSFFKTLREKFSPEEFQRQILNFPPVSSGIAIGQLTYDEQPVRIAKPSLHIPHIPEGVFTPQTTEVILTPESRKRLADMMNPIMRVSMYDVDRIVLPEHAALPIVTDIFTEKK